MSGLKNFSTILFQGDSITDCSRLLVGNGLGEGYVYMINEYIKKEMADLNISVVNRGIAGNKSTDLQARWKEDCLDIESNVLSLYVGVNDIWHRFSNSLELPDGEYDKAMHDLIDRYKEKYPESRIIVMSPFLMSKDDPAKTWSDSVNKYIGIAEEIAKEYKADFINMQELLDSQNKPALELTTDGVHPTEIGHKIIADKWIEIMLK